MSRTFDFLFYPKKPKDYKEGPVKLYLRITIDNKRSETAVALEVLPEKWKSGKMKGNKEDARTFNTYLDTLKSNLYECHRYLLNSGANITAETLRNAFNGKGERPRLLLEIFKAHNTNIEKLIGKDYSKPTLTKYNTTLHHLESFLKWKYKISDINLANLTYEFLSDFEFYLKTQLGIGHNTTAKYIKNTKKIVTDCLKKKWIKDDPFAEFQIKTIETDPTFLLDYELAVIESKEFKIERLSNVRDLFIFSCYTGLAFVDVCGLTPGHVAVGIDGEKWIFTGRQKSNVPSHIPLLPAALHIIAKYKDNPVAISKGKLLPMISNQKMNGYLKEIADLCGINKNLTYHVARHTFATTVTLTNGVPIESVSKMLGHKKIQTTQHYARILDKKVSNDMSALREKFTPKLTPIKDIAATK